MSDVSRTVAALFIAIAARAVPLLALLLLCATPGPAQAQDNDPVPPVDPVCVQAADLNADALPAQAIAVIDAYRTSLGETGAAACQAQYTAALQQQSRAKQLVALADGDPDAPGTAVAGCAPGAGRASTTYAAAALTCDRENGDAASLAEEPKPAFWAKWNAFYDDSLAPLVDVLLTWLAMLAGLVLLARLLVPAFPKMQPRRGWFAPLLVTIGVLMFVFGLFATNEPSVGLGLVIWLLGVALITGLAAALAKAVAPRLQGTVSEPTIGMVAGVALAGLGCAFILADARWPVVVLWGCVALAGAVVWAFSWSRVLRIHIAVQLADATEDSAAQGQIIALLHELGGRSPRGLESPRGADTTALANAGLATTPEGRILKAVYNAVQIILPTTPWRVRVDIAGPDRWSVDITRNGRAVRSLVIDRDRLGLRVPVKDAQGEPRKEKDGPVYPSLDRMAAAAVLCTLDEAYGWDSLCGTTSWESLGLHAIATTDFAQTDSDATALLTKALWRDPGNRLAQVALWHHQHRRETETDKLQEYLDLLDGYVAAQRSRNQALEGADLTGTPAGDAVLLLRVLYTRVAVYINLQASKGRYLPGDEQDRVAELRQCWEELGAGDQPVAEYRKAHADEQENLLASVIDTPPGSRSWLLPRLAYQRACELVSRRQQSPAPGTGRRVAGNPDHAPPPGGRRRGTPRLARR